MVANEQRILTAVILCDEKDDGNEQACKTHLKNNDDDIRTIVRRGVVTESVSKKS